MDLKTNIIIQTNKKNNIIILVFLFPLINYNN